MSEGSPRADEEREEAAEGSEESGPEARWIDRLRRGASTEDEALARELGLGTVAGDRELARALVRQVAEKSLRAIGVAEEPERAERRRPAAEPALVGAADSSFLGQLSVRPKKDGGGVARIDDIRTLIAVLRGGAPLQRRAAAARLGERLREDGKEITSDEQRDASAALSRARSSDIETTYEAWRALEQVPGSAGREARSERQAALEVLEDLPSDIHEFWEGSSGKEPISELSPARRAHLMLWTREMPDVVTAHIRALLEESDGSLDRPARASLLASLRYSGDARLVPALVTILRSRTADLLPDAARALCRIDDPRTHGALVDAYERSVFDEEKTILAGALGVAGDFRGRDYVRKVLKETDDERVLLVAAEAMEGLAASEDWGLLAHHLKSGDTVLLGHTIRALGRAGDARALGPLAELRTRSAVSAIRAQVEEAEGAILAQLELRGEEPPAVSEQQALSVTRDALAARKRDPVVVRFSSWKDYVLGQLWLALGATRRAIARFERAAARRAGWAPPLAAIALAQSKESRDGAALAAFRRAIEADRGWVEAEHRVVHTLARVFLRRAEAVEHDGRPDIARGLIEEALSLDLRRVPGQIRFELIRRLEGLRARRSA